MDLRPVIGVFLNLEIWFFFLLNIICLVCIFKSRLFANDDNPAYLITCFNLLSETFQLAMHVVYIGPSILLGDWIFPGGQGSLPITVISTYFLGFWYLGSFIQILMAMNRLSVVFFPGRKLMTHFRISLIMFIMLLVTIGSVTYSQLLSPCCRITPDYHTFSYSYLPVENETVNLSMMFVDLPIDSSTSIICAVSYISLFIYVYHMSSSEGGVKKREIRLTIQFVIMFACYTVAWVTFFLFPMFGIERMEPYAATSSMLVANCGVNAVVYLTMNKEIRLELRKLAGKVAPSAVYHSTSHPNDALSTRQTHPDNEVSAA